LAGAAGSSTDWEASGPRVHAPRAERRAVETAALATGFRAEANTLSVVVPVADDVVSILVAVDEDTGAGLDVELWAIVDADTLVPLINAEPQ